MVALVLSALSTGTSGAVDLERYSGGQLYQRFCAACHGMQAHGDGPVANSFKVPPPDLTLIAKRHGGKFPAADVRRTIDGRSKVVSHGESNMPVWGEDFTYAEGSTPEARQRAESIISRLVDYLASIQAH